MTDWLDRLHAGPPLLLDGATGTELERRGSACELPLWSAWALLRDPSLVRSIHADYARAGADLLTANTFRTQRRTLDRAQLGERAAELTQRALELAREGARESGRALPVLGSAAPLEDCFRPDLVPGDEELAAEHAEHAANLARAGADAILIETMNTIREARVALDCARATGLPVLLSFVCGPDARLLSGESLGQALEVVREGGPAAVLVNCLPPSRVPACLEVLRSCGLPFGVYPNLGAPLDAAGRRHSEECSPERFAELASSWIAAGAALVGGCCGTTAAHVCALSQHLRRH